MINGKKEVSAYETPADRQSTPCHWATTVAGAVHFANTIIVVFIIVIFIAVIIFGIFIMKTQIDHARKPHHCFLWSTHRKHLPIKRTQGRKYRTVALLWRVFEELDIATVILSVWSVEVTSVTTILVAGGTLKKEKNVISGRRWSRSLTRARFCTSTCKRILQFLFCKFQPNVNCDQSDIPSPLLSLKRWWWLWSQVARISQIGSLQSAEN